MTTWQQHQQWESDWWGNCANTYAEETKQLTYAHRMGLINTPQDGKWPVYDVKGQSILDIGGGPVSMLLRAVNLNKGCVVDPCLYPFWINRRYSEANIDYLQIPAEEYTSEDTDTLHFDECWIYNVLQHVQSPELIIANARKSANLIRIFEWIDMAPMIGHPHELKEDQLNTWLDGVGTTEQMDENGCIGRAYYGVFT